MDVLLNEFKNFEKTIPDDDRLPEELTRDYRLLELLADNGGCKTMLALRLSDEKRCVVKCYDISQTELAPGATDRLIGFSCDGIPAFLGRYRSESVDCVVREFVPGITLEAAVAKRRFTPGEAVALCERLCDIVGCLHGHNPPILHRDIKPQNIIIGEDGKASLIDFSIARVEKSSAQKDTVVAGTVGFAAPEQYGFLQTDRRSDVYSIGVILCYVLTGDSRFSALTVKSCGDKRLYRIIRKCTAFLPEKRYSDTNSLRAALRRWRRRHIFNALAIAAVLLAVGLFAVNAVLAVTHTLRLYDSRYYSPNQLEYDGHLYMLSFTPYDQWQDIEEYCEDLGGHLATVTSAGEDEFLFNQINETRLEKVHIGLTLDRQENKWEWVTGEPVDYTNWGEGEPNDCDGEESYAMYYLGEYPDGEWNDGYLSECGIFFCEWDYPPRTFGSIARDSAERFFCQLASLFGF